MVYSTRSDRNKFQTIVSKIIPSLRLVVRLLLAIVFIFSGFVKAVDPLGSTYKFEDYCYAFGGIFQALVPLALPAAITLSSIELLIGLSFLFKVRIRRTAMMALVFMLVMTPLTLYVAINNPVSDCGCFGDALVISNWATFWKNIVLLALVVAILFFSRQIRPLFLTKIERIMTGVFILIGVSVSVYSYRHLPLIDFRPYKVGVNIPEAMKLPPGASPDKYLTTFIYEKNGVQKEFTLENYPKGDSTWKFVDQKTRLISKGFQPKIHDFSILNPQYDDITKEVLDDKGKTFLLVMYDLEKTSQEGARAAEPVYQKAKQEGISFYALTASSDEEIEAFRKQTGVTFPFCKTDPITLKTVIRANPGLVLLQDGTIKGKWNWRDFKEAVSSKR